MVKTVFLSIKVDFSIMIDERRILACENAAIVPMSLPLGMMGEPDNRVTKGQRQPQINFCYFITCA